MTTEPEPTTEPAPTILKFSDLKKMMTDLVDGAISAREPKQQEGEGNQRRSTRERQPQRDIDSEVQKALDKLEHEKSERAERDALKTDVADLKERTKERAPVERRRVHRIMGWGE